MIATVMTDPHISELHHMLSRHSLRNHRVGGGKKCQQSYSHLVLLEHHYLVSLRVIEPRKHDSGYCSKGKLFRNVS